MKKFIFTNLFPLEKRRLYEIYFEIPKLKQEGYTLNSIRVLLGYDVIASVWKKIKKPRNIEYPTEVCSVCERGLENYAWKYGEYFFCPYCTAQATFNNIEILDFKGDIDIETEYWIDFFRYKERMNARAYMNQ